MTDGLSSKSNKTDTQYMYKPSTSDPALPLPAPLAFVGYGEVCGYRVRQISSDLRYCAVLFIQA